MKANLFALLVAVTVSMPAFAEVLPLPITDIPEDSVAISPAQGFATTEVDGFIFPVCAPEAECQPMSKVKIDLTFYLGGCLDELGPVTYAYDRSDDGKKLTVYVSAVRVLTRGSMAAMCFTVPQAYRELELTLSAGVEQVEVKFLTNILK